MLDQLKPLETNNITTARKNKKSPYVYALDIVRDEILINWLTHDFQVK